LCDHMEITGFYSDGGFAPQILVPEASLIPMPENLDPHIACFGEPVGCVINAFEKMPLSPGKKLLIYGGGTMGLIAAVYGRHLGLLPLILEKDAAKIRKITPILEALDLPCVQETRESHFPLVINACGDYIAFCQAITKVDKGGHLSFFSGISKNETLETNLVNLLHYKEVGLSGAYGMKKSDMEKALPFLASHSRELSLLVEEIVPLEKAPELLPRVLTGQQLKYILDFTGTPCTVPAPETALPESSSKAFHTKRDDPFDEAPALGSVLEGIQPLDPDMVALAQAKMDDKSKPLGALGKLEPLAVRLAMIRGTLNPSIPTKALLVFAGDHGVTEEGVSAFPSEVTGQMVENFLNGGAAINVLCRHHGIAMKVVDMGVKKEFSPHPMLIRSKVAPGSRNMALEPAMTRDQAIQALQAGMDAFFSLNENAPVHILGLGEMGIGNTTSATA
ncbi:MAG: nicotinate-nucleotide--dimethylbenzimidazole phosphoribosyltransferase, partial [Desulfobacterales bacterium]|nr:nicotinate-nucleotide--dimethylbenzimidazole phosphoribosyltransferase [Desulfobacterales bacterium]